jgi:anti-sigma factor RsiW
MSSELHADKRHEKFKELCALAASRGLTADESAELKSHLEKCEGCREILAQYRALGTRGFAALAARHSEHHDSQSWDKSDSWEKLLARLRDDRTPSAIKPAQRASVSIRGWLGRIRARWFKRMRLGNSSANSK